MQTGFPWIHDILGKPKPVVAPGHGPMETTTAPDDDDADDDDVMTPTTATTTTTQPNGKNPVRVFLLPVVASVIDAIHECPTGASGGHFVCTIHCFNLFS